MELINKLIQDFGWYIKEEENYILLSSKNFETENYVDVEDIIMCTSEGVFKNNRGKKQFLFDFEIQEKNMFATYLYIQNNEQTKNIIQEQKNNIQNSNDNNIGNIFSSFFTEECLKENLNLNINNMKNNALNVVINDKFYDLIYIKDDYSVILQGATTLKELYSDIFKYLYSKVEFDKIIKENYLDLSSEEILKLFQIFVDKQYSNPNKINDQKKTL